MAIQVLYVGLFVFLHMSVSQGSCPDGWVHDDSSCYLFSDVAETWVLASAHCGALGAKLVTIKSQEEDLFLRQTIHNIYHGDTRHAVYWAGGTDFATEARWVWGLEEKPITGYTNWSPGQPDNYDGHHKQDCLCLAGSFNLTWDDTYCQNNFRFICERNEIIPDSEVIG